VVRVAVVLRDVTRGERMCVTTVLQSIFDDFLNKSYLSAFWVDSVLRDVRRGERMRVTTV
jgi:hypothetical protein